MGFYLTYQGDAPRPSGRPQQPKREGSNVNGSSRHETKSFTTRGKKWSISFLVLGEFALTQKVSQRQCFIPTGPSETKPFFYNYIHHSGAVSVAVWRTVTNTRTYTCTQTMDIFLMIVFKNLGCLNPSIFTSAFQISNINASQQGPINVCCSLPVWPQGRLDNTLFGMSIWRDNETG